MLKVVDVTYRKTEGHTHPDIIVQYRGQAAPAKQPRRSVGPRQRGPAGTGGEQRKPAGTGTKPNGSQP